ncbi:hypothetical protein EVAR_55252_1 [Eumeta japonica]|uniref:Uncharacterized protein n=1 Tax=Eumeta variegata TaxID=151549 RepID=A0A4C1Z627_EUMVA|nr:hypothetical protein EVAR_55252_1 [Eumeta japonica]
MTSVSTAIRHYPPPPDASRSPARGRRDSLLRLVDTQFAHDKAVAHFTRLTKKISSVQSLLRPPAAAKRN